MSTRLSWVQEHAYQPHWQAGRHAHEQVEELLLVISGQMRVELADRVVTAGPGTAVCYPRGCGHREQSVSREPLRLLCAEFSGAVEQPIVSFDSHGLVTQSLNWIRSLRHAAAPEDAVQGVWSATFFELQKPKEPPGLVATVEAHVTANMTESISLTELAEIAGMGRSQFAARFRSASGVPPMRFVAMLRVAHTKQLLTQTDLPLKQIAPRVGLRDEFELSRVFKRLTGRSPGDLRNATAPSRVR